MSEDMETPLDALERLHFRTGEMLDYLEKVPVGIPLWKAMTLERAMMLAKEVLEREDRI